MSEVSSVNETLQSRWARLSGYYRDNERLLLFLFVLGTATIPYFFINKLTNGRPTTQLHTWVDAAIPFQAGWEYVYMTFQLMCLFPFAVIRDLHLLRRTTQAYAMVYGVAYLSFIIFPVQMVRYMHTDVQSYADWGVKVNLALDGPFNCFPSLHVSIAIVAAWAVWKANRRIGVPTAILAVLIAASTLMLKQHWVADVLAALVLSNAAAYKFLWPYRRTSRSSFPAWFALVFPLTYAVAISTTYLMYRAGVPAPEPKWEAAMVRVPNPPAVMAEGPSR